MSKQKISTETVDYVWNLARNGVEDGLKQAESLGPTALELYQILAPMYRIRREGVRA